MTVNKNSKLYAPIDFDVIDSAAFADLTGAAVKLLLIITRQWNNRNNGLLQATYSYCRRRGIGSQSTLQVAIASLISHGFIYRTRCHGMSFEGKNIAARYAITWKSLCDKNLRTGIFVDGFVPNAFMKWKSQKIGGTKIGAIPLQKLVIHADETP